MGDVVLVHGTTQNAAGFWGLADALQGYGHRVLTVDVPSGLPTDLRDPVVAAHSAAGLVLPAPAAHLGATHQVWMAAFVPDHAGRTSLLDQVRADPTALFHPRWVGVDPAADPELAALYAEAPQRDPAAVASTYLQPTDDRTLTQRAMERTARQHLHVGPIRIPGGHNAYVAHPEPIAEAIDAATVAGRSLTPQTSSRSRQA